ncbi:DUF3592 domain-containing protein [Humibacter sp. RRB41]|uniref:DUF3592 domain-containing protein n=1 Tax=Humibacter sp. RRB41 TaxID=2919946 RepID=UPI001FAA7533|nr:DUF3592 domain-containing protein [Humibacter sp. RRB41]
MTAPKTTKQKNQKKSGPGYVATVVALALGAIFFVGGLVPLIGQIVLATHSSSASAVVVGYSTHRSGGKYGCGGTAYNPTVSFTDQRGTKVTATLSNMLICSQPSKGATIKVVYDTTNPTNAEFPSASDNWVWPIVALVLGALFIVAAAAMFRSTRRTRAAVARGEPIPGSKNQAKKREQARQRDVDRRASEYVRGMTDQQKDGRGGGQ